MTPATFKQWRKRLNISQQAAADNLDVKVLTVKRWEAGSSNIKAAIEKLCTEIEASGHYSGRGSLGKVGRPWPKRVTRNSAP